MKKIISFILIIISSISVVSAKSINDLYNELNSLETKKNLYNYLTHEQIEKGKRKREEKKASGKERRLGKLYKNIITYPRQDKMKPIVAIIRKT